MTDDEGLTLIVAGVDDDQLFADAFVDQVEAFLHALTQSDSEASPSGQPRMSWLIKSLSRSSPALVVFEPKPEPDISSEASEETIGQFFQILDFFQNGGDIPKHIKRGTVEAFRELGKPVQSGKVQATIRGADKQARIQPTLTHRADAVLAPRQTAFGFIEGRLQRITTHNKLRMWVYPWVGPTRVRCQFSEDQIEDAGNALDKWVRVHGELSYPAHSMHPDRIRVERIETLPAPDEVPRLTELRGIAPDATEGKSSEEFVRGLRDEW